MHSPSLILIHDVSYYFLIYKIVSLSFRRKYPFYGALNSIKWFLENFSMFVVSKPPYSSVKTTELTLTKFKPNMYFVSVYWYEYYTFLQQISCEYYFLAVGLFQFPLQLSSQSSNFLFLNYIDCFLCPVCKLKYYWTFFKFKIQLELNVICTVFCKS